MIFSVQFEYLIEFFSTDTHYLTTQNDSATSPTTWILRLQRNR